MVDFGALGDKAKDLAGEHPDQVNEGVDKAGDFAGDKLGHDKVDGLTDKAKDALGGLGGGGDEAAAEPAQDQPPA
ncbi:MAG: antitoxin [Nakamurella sp.]